MARDFTSSSSTVLRSPKPADVVTVLVALAAAGGIAAAAVFATAPQIAGAVYLLFIALFAVKTLLWDDRRQFFSEVGELVATPDGLRLDGREVVPRSSVCRWLLLHVGGPAKPRVQCVGWSGAVLVEIEVSNEDEGRALIAAAQIGRADGVLTFHLTPALFTRDWCVGLLAVVPILVGPSLMTGIHSFCDWFNVPGGSAPHFFLVWTLVAVLLAVSIGIARWSRVMLCIGTDGFLIRSSGRRHFIRRAEVASVDRWPTRVVGSGPDASEGFDLVLRSGRIFRISTRQQRLVESVLYGDFIAFEVEGVVRDQESGHLGSGLPCPAPTEPLREWVEFTREQAVTPSGDYRHTTWSRADLWVVLRDPGALPVHRAACAAVLGGERMSDEDRQRIRSIASATASPALRQTLMAAADGAESSLEEGLRALVVS